ncbi:MAG: ferrous iron transport protein B [Clostridia bacterium]|nr:ferrous iron transport protein B [Clostridia bacterium]
MKNKKSPFEKEHKKFHKGSGSNSNKDAGELALFHDHTSDSEIENHHFHTGHRFALVGNPNCGKTTLFNYLTGSSQYVGNWPGVTVEKKEGMAKMGGENLRIVDLPGIYSLSPYSPEEVVARNFILDEKPDLIINIVDATNLERNLYLTTQLLELGIPMIVALNMYDIIRANGDTIDEKAISAFLGVPVVPISANKGDGIMELMHEAHELAESQIVPTYVKIYSDTVSQAILEIADTVQDECILKDIPITWAAVKLFEGDIITVKRFSKNTAAMEKIEKIRQRIPVSNNVDHEIIVADQRYKYIEGIVKSAVTRKVSAEALTVSDKIDKYVTHKYFAIPIFIVVMLTVFFITFGPPGTFLTDTVSGYISDVLTPGVAGLLTKIGASDWAVGLLCDGLLAGVGAVLSFLPQITILFLFLSLLEDSGYMSRAAFIMDKALRKIGLSGKSFVPILMGFGCTVPAVMATRTLENDKDRRLTIMLTPFMSCPAKMPVYAMIIAAFFAGIRPVIVLGLYILGIILAIITGIVMNKTVLKGEPSHFVMELPPYRMPTIRGLLIHLWERIKDFISKAGTVIMGATAIIWFLQSYDFSLKAVDSAHSILASLGKLIAPIFTLCGFGNWETAVSLITGVFAKEQIVSTMTVLYGDEAGIITSLRSVMSPLSALSFLVFVLLYTPCIAAVSTIAREMKSRKWTAFVIIFQLLLAWTASMLVYQIGSLFI